MMYSISSLAKRFGLSRSTLLYYDSIGLLPPAGRSAADYRQYDDRDLRRLEEICLYRQTGLALSEIKHLLDPAGGELAGILQKRLAELNQEIGRLRRQQEVLVRILESPEAKNTPPILNKSAWVALLRASGVTEAQMHRWHREFEKMSPEAHHGFLASLGIPPDEIARIREEAGRG